MSHQSIEKIFTRQVSNFVEELHRMFPQDKDFRLAEYSMYVCDEKMVFKTFKNALTPYKIPIQTRDESFFLDKNKELIPEKFQSTWSTKLVDKLKLYWRSLDDDSKNSIWQYFNVFMVLLDKKKM